MTQKSMNGREQVNALARLAKPLSTDQQAPAESAWKPDNLAGFRIGDAVRLPNLECNFQVVGFQHPALLILKSPSGKEVKAGWRSVTKIRTYQEIHNA